MLVNNCILKDELSWFYLCIKYSFAIAVIHFHGCSAFLINTRSPTQGSIDLFLTYLYFLSSVIVTSRVSSQQLRTWLQCKTQIFHMSAVSYVSQWKWKYSHHLVYETGSFTVLAVAVLQLWLLPYLSTVDTSISEIPYLWDVLRYHISVQ